MLQVRLCATAEVLRMAVVQAPRSVLSQRGWWQLSDPVLGMLP